MFSLATGVYESYFASPQLNVLVIGCESAGKTALLERVKVTEFSTKAPPKNSGSKLLSCPAPKRYSQAALDDNDMHVNADSSEEVFEPSARFVTPQISSQENMEDVIFESPVQALDEVNTRNEEFNVKPGHSMLPMVKIRPTSK